MIRAACYSRVSDASQGEADRQSLPYQREAFTNRCAERGYTAGEIYVDVESGTKVGRIAYQRMLADAKAGQFDVLVVTYLDRFGRDQWEVMGALRDLRQANVTVDSLNDDTSEFVMVALSAWKADQESKRIGQRVKDASHRAVREGRPMGQFPYGYRRQRDESGFRMVPDPDEAAVVREIYRLYVEDGLSMSDIRTVLNQRATPAPRGTAWSAESVRYVLLRPTYTGDYVYGETRVQQGHDPIVDRETWEAAQRRRLLRKGLPAGRTHRSDYLLSGVIFCAHCGGRMEGNTSYLVKGRYTYRRYSCAAYRKTQTCTFRNQHDADQLEAAVLADLTALCEQDEGVRRESRVVELRASLAATTKALTALPERFLRNMRLFDSGAIASEAQLRLANQRLEAEQESLTAERDRLTAALAAEEAGDERASTFPMLAAILREDWTARSPAQRKALIQDVIERVEVTSGSYEPRIVLR